ncbi:MAG: R3H domain-containing nucleic acid-binding protein [Patescibacteria group bacterium]
MEDNVRIQHVTETILEKLELVGAVVVSTDETDAFRVAIETEETGLLIGYHGKTLESMQAILGIIVSKELGRWVKIYVNVGDYREKREEALMHMALRAADRAVSMGREVDIPRLSASERRIVHLTLSGDDRVETESTGEGENRTLLVRPKA